MKAPCRKKLARGPQPDSFANKIIQWEESWCFFFDGELFGTGSFGES